MHYLWKRFLVLAVVMFLLLFFIVYGVLGSARADLGPSKSYISPDKEVILVHTLFRHGHRTPADTYPNDPFFNETFYPYGWGQLTNPGKKYLFEMGEYLHRRYGDFLGKYYQPDVLHAQTTGVTRTRMSMLLVLAGLWPPKDSPTEWNKKLNWQPIPIESEPLDQDSLLLVRTPCARYSEAVEEVLQSAEVQSAVDPYVDMMRELTEITGLDIKTPDDVQSLFSTLKAEEEYGLKLPEWTKRFYPEKLLPLTELSYVWNVHTPEMKRLKAGPFLQKLVDEWKAASEGNLKPKDRKMYLYTGHDSSVVNVLHALGVWDYQLPDYAIMGMFELLRDRPTGQLGVQLYLRNSTAEPVPLTLPGCDFFCPLEKAFQLITPVLPVNREEECKPKDPNFSTPPPSGP
ncbi:venom acid phosphatase Acph-1-like [Phlebotomus papatasi]|uniref:venom acid phosphatase Acph-1-like n=1 Tax=Phlebotomus papatasi TaxID=29031 RepID=UPI0024835C86|nr:venom acid phosphatase Acph-1-like [Phlebotomus papatasi]XP_055700910.1 venom acid phosphatase Acph-1-like [Phlebotomus papatasi]XP_055700911.1 venom acid phosphatase Acph-1-like [Phlebotomus papatasi]XP_055700913.1 venom acid phosphatase Acph-1-like [Phlebotomus papatasi]XP_055700914.1 venom acid phosphatase Acph-1-like [Phlebotomus papatasi]XP_055700915.1 venom acid phosphatase Acph-1-like [Phlebotomus papatasi]XP_055700916.1 venom acid phosphatase Acph-1-like [Phlebotomus papatasi]